jgi:GNAT superfamily N-acetyltransferase
MPELPYKLRPATMADVSALHELIARSSRGLSAPHYRPEQVEGALQGSYGVDTALIRDGTYFVAIDDAGQIAGCGGWSRRHTMFGSDAGANRDDRLLDPGAEPAKIRAFFVDPRHARRGIGRMILERSESDARGAGFSRLELMATLPGVPLYERFGYAGGAPQSFPLPGGLSIDFVPMSKVL